MVKVEILLSSLDAAACTAGVGIAVWKLVLGRAPDGAPPTPDAGQSTHSSAQYTNADKASVMKTALPTEGEDGQVNPPHVEKQEVQACHEWKVGGSRECLLRSMADKPLPCVTKPAEDRDWDSASDITEWSSIADDDDVFDTPTRSYQPASSARRWVHVGYGRYVKV